jgi:hypothetical protein
MMGAFVDRYMAVLKQEADAEGRAATCVSIQADVPASSPFFLTEVVMSDGRLMSVGDTEGESMFYGYPGLNLWPSWRKRDEEFWSLDA